jgi:transposase
MVIKRCRGRLPVARRHALVAHFVAGVTARAAAEVVGVNRRTATLYYHKLRELIAARLEEEAPFSVGDVEVDESYFGGVRKGMPERITSIATRHWAQVSLYTKSR